MLHSATYFVCYQIQSSCSQGHQPLVRDGVVKILEPQNPASLPYTLKVAVRPPAEPDPSDGFKGSRPEDVTLLNFIKLS